MQVLPIRLLVTERQSLSQVQFQYESKIAWFLMLGCFIDDLASVGKARVSKGCLREADGRQGARQHFSDVPRGSAAKRRGSPQ